MPKLNAGIDVELKSGLSACSGPIEFGLTDAIQCECLYAKELQSGLIRSASAILFLEADDGYWVEVIRKILPESGSMGTYPHRSTAILHPREFLERSLATSAYFPAGALSAGIFAMPPHWHGFGTHYPAPGASRRRGNGACMVVVGGHSGGTVTVKA